MSADTPTPEAKPGPASPRSYNRRTPLYVLMGLFAVCDLAIATVVDAHSDTAGGTLLGIVFSQVILLAVGSAFGPFGAISRTVLGAVLATLIGFILLACIHNNTGNGRVEWLWFLIVVSQWFAIHSSLWVVRLCFGWRLASTADGITTSNRSDMQFGIRQLLTWTALVAATLGVGRWWLPADVVGGYRGKESILIFCVLTSFTCLLAWPVIWASLTRRWLPLWLIAAALCCVAITLAEILTFQFAMTGPGDVEIFWIMNSIQAIAACVGLMVVRVSGFRLVRATVGQAFQSAE